MDHNLLLITSKHIREVNGIVHWKTTPLCHKPMEKSNDRSYLFVCLQSHEQFFSYLVAVTIAGDRAANLSLRLALRAFEGVPHLLRHETSVYTVSS
jgi:hypothetical protein